MLTSFSMLASLTSFPHLTALARISRKMLNSIRDGGCRRHRRPRFSPWVGELPWRRKRQPPPAFLPGGCCGQRSLAGCSPRGHKELDRIEVTQTPVSSVSVSTPIAHLIPPFPSPLGVHMFVLYTCASSSALQMVVKLLWPFPLLTNFHALVFFLACSLQPDFY